MQTYTDCFLENFMNKVLPEKKPLSKAMPFDDFLKDVGTSVKTINDKIEDVLNTEKYQSTLNALIQQTGVVDTILINRKDNVIKNINNLTSTYTAVQNYYNILVSVREAYKSLKEENDVCDFVLGYGERVVQSLALKKEQKDQLMNLIIPLTQTYKKLEEKTEHITISLNNWVLAVENAPQHFHNEDDFNYVQDKVTNILEKINPSSKQTQTKPQTKPQTTKISNVVHTPTKRVPQPNVQESIKSGMERLDQLAQMRDIASREKSLLSITNIKQRILSFDTEGLNITQVFAISYLAFLASYNNLDVDTICDFAHIDGTPIKSNTVKAITGNDVHKYFGAGDLVKDKLLYNLITIYHYLVQMFHSLNDRKDFTKGYLHIDFRNLEFQLPKDMQMKLIELNEILGEDYLPYNMSYISDFSDIINMLGNNIISCLNKQSSVYSTTFFIDYNKYFKLSNVKESQYIATYVQIMESRPHELFEKFQRMYNIVFPNLNFLELDVKMFTECLKTDSDKELIIKGLLPQHYHIEELLQQVMLFFINNFKMLFKYSCIQYVSHSLIIKYTDQDVLHSINELIDIFQTVDTKISSNEKSFVKGLLEENNYDYKPLENEDQLYVKHLQQKFVKNLNYIKMYCENDFLLVRAQVAKHAKSLPVLHTFFGKCIADLFNTKSKSVEIPRPFYIKVDNVKSSEIANNNASESLVAQTNETAPIIQENNTIVNEVIFTHTLLPNPRERKKYLNISLTSDKILEFHLTEQQWFPSDENDNQISYKQMDNILYCQIPALANMYNDTDTKKFQSRFLGMSTTKDRLKMLFNEEDYNDIYNYFEERIKEYDSMLLSLKRIDVYWSYPHWNFNPYDNYRICDLSEIDNLSILTDNIRGSINFPTLIYHICRKNRELKYDLVRNNIKIFNQYKPLKEFFEMAIKITATKQIKSVIQSILDKVNKSYKEYITLIKLVERIENISLTEDKVAYLRICLTMKRNLYKSVYEHFKNIQNSSFESIKNYQNPSIFNPNFFREDADTFSKFCDIVLTNTDNEVGPVIYDLLEFFNKFKQKNKQYQAYTMVILELKMLKDRVIKPPGRIPFPFINVDEELDELLKKLKDREAVALPPSVKKLFNYVSDSAYIKLKLKSIINTDSPESNVELNVFEKDRTTFDLKINPDGFVKLYEFMSGLDYNDIRKYVWKVRNQVSGNELNRKVIEFLIWKNNNTLIPKTLKMTTDNIMNKEYYNDFFTKIKNNIEAKTLLSFLPPYKGNSKNSSLQDEFSKLNVKFSFVKKINTSKL